jgi:hypothetical protein
VGASQKGDAFSGPEDGQATGSGPVNSSLIRCRATPSDIGVYQRERLS